MKVAETRVFSNSHLISHSLAWKDWEPVSLSEDVVPWGGRSPPSLVDTTPASEHLCWVHCCRKTDLSVTHWVSLCLAVACLFYSKQENDQR